MRPGNQLSVFAMTLLLISSGWAGNAGKIAGRIVDKETGEFLAGANIVVEGTNLGASASADGFFSIMGAAPGFHTVRAMYIGYHTLTINEVLVRADLTTVLDIELEPSVIETPTVSVYAERALVWKDVTSTRRVTTSEDIKNLPGVYSVSDILLANSGVIVDLTPIRLDLGGGSQLQVRDESIKNIHVRGGRGGEILFMVDGMPVTHPLYGGRDVMDLNVEEVEQIEFLTGAFNAEYGNAQSGVVNITTRVGSDKREFGVEFKQDFTSNAFGRSQNFNYFSFSSGGRLNFLGDGTRFGKLYYFVSSNINLTDTPLDNGRSRDQLNIFGLFSVRERQQNKYGFNAKLTWEPSKKSKLLLSYQGSWLRNSDFSWSFINYPDNTPEYARNNMNLNLRYNRILSENTYYNFNFGLLKVDYQASLGRIPTWQPEDSTLSWESGVATPEDFWRIIPSSTGTDSIAELIVPPRVDVATRFNTNEGYRATWRDDNTLTYTAKFEIASQIHRKHLIKVGTLLQYHDISFVDLQDAAFKLSRYGEYLYRDGDFTDKPPGPYPEFGQNRWFFQNRPLLGDLYIQDKFEHEALIINVGARLDWIYLGSELNDKKYVEQWQAATGLETDWNLLKSAVSPRFGVSFPISEEMVLFFSYGHFNQLPELQFYYRDPWSGGLTGNPHMGFESTILYEFGLTRQFGEHWVVDVKSFGKDISEQVQSELLKGSLGLPVELMVNNGYGRARGFEFNLEKGYYNYTTFNIGYTLQWADGFASSAFADYVRTQLNLPKPIREKPLSWDIRHQVILNASMIVPPGKRPSIFGVKLPSDWRVSLLARLSTGRPYTPGTLDPLEARVRENTETSPLVFSSDLKLSKSFSSRWGSYSVFVDIFSIFNHRNAIRSVNNWTGEPLKYGDTAGGTQDVYSYQDMYQLMNPREWSAPRHYQVGLRFRL